MAPRLPSLVQSPIGFAHRGAKAHARENTIEAFLLGKKLGATGLESDVWVTADGHAVLDHDGRIGFLRRQEIRRVRRADLPAHIPSMDEFYDACGTDTPFSLDVKDPAALDAVLRSARNAGGEAEEHLWLCHPELEILTPWRTQTSAKLVDSTRLSKLREGPERRASQLRNDGIEAINMRNIDWTGGMISTFHRFGRLALGWDAQHDRELLSLLDAGIDGVYSDHVDRMRLALDYFYPKDP